MKEQYGNFLFSIDLEDVRHGVPEGLRYREGVPGNTYRYLDWLDSRGFKCTFFVTGQVAESYPSLIKEIVLKGHEIACHTTKHIPLTMFTPDEFRKDLDDNISLLLKTGIEQVKGFRAPSYSIRPETSWVYDILIDMGFEYSTSILSAKKPFTGWPDFGTDPCIIKDRFIEIPISLFNLGPFAFPLAGGAYFRILPEFLINHLLRVRRKEKKPIIGYFHPYDIDTEQEHFIHGGINDNRFYNFLMYYNRKCVFPRLEKVLDSGYKIITFSEYIMDLKEANGLRICKAFN